MASTKYQILCRYINESTNTAITNNPKNEYVKAEEFLTKYHPIQNDKINSENGENEIKSKAESKLEEIVSHGNSVKSTKNDMIFAYNGTKKIKHSMADKAKKLSDNYPYVIKDSYVRIKMSPWFTYSTHGSLESAVERAKVLIESIGMENVKLIKIVPFDQFVKIK